MASQFTHAAYMNNLVYNNLLKILPCPFLASPGSYVNLQKNSEPELVKEEKLLWIFFCVFLSYCHIRTISDDERALLTKFIRKNIKLGVYRRGWIAYLNTIWDILDNHVFQISRRKMYKTSGLQIFQ